MSQRFLPVRNARPPRVRPAPAPRPRYERFGRASLSEFLGDFVVWRNLAPADARLPDLARLRAGLGLAAGERPRKAEPAYGRVVAELLREARRLTAPGAALARLVYIGDTRLNDGSAFRHICDAGGWTGRLFIGRDDPNASRELVVGLTAWQSNRWSALPEFLDWVEDRDGAVDESVAVVIDLDKTAIGARGRNDGPIDAARLDGLRATVAHLLGAGFDERAFRDAYRQLNGAEFHPFTADNQDYLAYLCLMLGAGVCALDNLVADIRSGALVRFTQFVDRVHARRVRLASAGLAGVHAEIRRRVRRGEPTPFPAFRRNEYRATAGRFGGPAKEPVQDLLGRGIVITEEVRAAALRLRAQGALVFGLSDKPDEAAAPPAAAAASGEQPLHRLVTWSVGEATG
jgi:hypothetical protein